MLSVGIVLLGSIGKPESYKHQEMHIRMIVKCQQECNQLGIAKYVFTFCVYVAVCVCVCVGACVKFN